jgi:hypothetical protein
MSRKDEMEMLRGHFDTTDTLRTPQSGESLRDFYRLNLSNSTSGRMTIFLSDCFL